MSLRSLLENGKTKLKSLRFGADNSFDRVGEGYSSQPYIVKQIPKSKISIIKTTTAKVTISKGCSEKIGRLLILLLVF